MKIVNIDGENFHLLKDFTNINNIVRKDVTYDNIKSKNKQDFTSSLSLEDIFLERKQEGQIESCYPPRPPCHLRIKANVRICV